MHFFYEDDNFLSLRLIDFTFLRIFDDVSKVVITALSQKILKSNLGIPESQELFPGLVILKSQFRKIKKNGLKVIVLDGLKHP